MSFKARPLVYIAAPLTKGDQFVNVRYAMLVWNLLHGLGFAPICPHWSAFQHILTPKPWGGWLEYDEQIIFRCDAMLRLPGESDGADCEVRFATENHIPVFHNIDDLVVWARGWGGDPRPKGHSLPHPGVDHGGVDGTMEV